MQSNLAGCWGGPTFQDAGVRRPSIMPTVIFSKRGKPAQGIAAFVLTTCAALGLASIAAGQIPTQQVNQGPAAAPPAASPTISKEAPDIPVDQVIQKFGARE